MESFPDYLLSLLSKKKMKQKDLSEKMGRSTSYISHFINSHRPVPKKHILEQLAAEMGCTQEERQKLLSFTGKNGVSPKKRDLENQHLMAPILPAQNCLDSKDKSIGWIQVGNIKIGIWVTT